MKIIILFTSILFSLSAHCQINSKCDEIIETKTYSGGVVMSSPKEKIKINKGGEKGLEVMIVKGEESLILNFSAYGDITCIGSNSFMNIEFTDGSKLKLDNMGGMNCKGNFSYFMGGVIGKEDVLKQLKSKSLKKIAIEYSEVKNEDLHTFMEETTFTKEQGQKIMALINCLSVM